MIGDIIKRLRKERGLTQKDLARLCQTSESSIKMIETNKNNPSLPLMDRIAAAFNVDASVILGEEEKTTVESFTMELLEKLLREGIISNINDIKQKELDLIISAVKMDLLRIKKGIN